MQNKKLKSPCLFKADIRFQASSLQALSREDQALFQLYGAGPSQTLPFVTLTQAFEAQVQQHPNLPAVSYQDETWTYREIDLAAERVKNALFQQGVREGDHVGIFLQRSVPMIISIFAVLKAGATYVPQHAGVATPETLRHVVKETQMQCVLTSERFQHLLPELPVDSILSVEDILKYPTDSISCSRFLEPIKEDPERACFVLFTSGTTGKPNGVRVTHKNICNILHTSPGNLGVRPGLKVSQILSIAFDMCAWEIFSCLSHGGHLLIRGKDIEETASQADVVIATPSILSRMNPEKFKNIQTVAVAGEPCSPALAKVWSQRSRFFNSCGPTEVTIVNTMHLVQSHAEKVSIGTPTPNNSVYVLDADLNPLPIGEIGEIWAGGDCVTAGYLNNPKLTRDRFVADPFLGGDRLMFRTRDLGRWNFNGELEHFGRTDDQVKIKGFRIELDSISAVLEELEPCQKAVTLKLDSETMVSFVIAHQFNENELREHLCRCLPYYCAPKLILNLSKFPETDRGKVDKRALTKFAIEIIENKTQGVSA